MVKAVFLDRDGTLVNDPGYAYKIVDFKFLPGVLDGLKRLSKEFIFFIITNQSGIGRGIYTEKDFIDVNNHLLGIFKKNKIKIKKTYHCPHTPEESCKCRKPSIKFIKEAEREFGIDLKNSWVAGDKPIDIEMGKKSGCKTVYLLTGQGKKRLDELKKNKARPEFIAEDFLEAADFIMKSIR